MNIFAAQVKSDSKKLEYIYDYSEIYLYPYARYALFEALKKLNIKSIYIPAFICRDILSPINTLNVRCYFYDVNEQFEPELKDINCDAILAVNYFGFSQNMEPFFEYKRRFNSIIIEDNAHGLLSRDETGMLLGCRGDIGLLSIRKTIFLPNGGALLVNNNDYKKINFKSADIKATHEDHKYYKKLFIKKIIFSNCMGIFIVLFRKLLKKYSIVQNFELNAENNLPSNKYLTPLLEGKSIYINIDAEIQRRQELYLKIQKWGKEFEINPIFKLKNNTAPYLFPFVDIGNNCKKFESYLLKKGFYVLRWPDLPDDIIKNCKELYKNVKVVHFSW